MGYRKQETKLSFDCQGKGEGIVLIQWLPNHQSFYMNPLSSHLGSTKMHLRKCPGENLGCKSCYLYS